MSKLREKFSDKLHGRNGVLVTGYEEPQPDPKGKKLVDIEFSDPEIKFDKEFNCPTCGEKVKVTKEQVLNVGSPVVSTAPAYSEYAKVVSRYHDSPGKFKDYFEYAVPFAKAEHDLSAIGNRTLSLATSVPLPCGHAISVSIKCTVEDVEEPRKTGVLRKLGVSTENAEKWLSYVYTGRVNEAFGKKKAKEITSIINAYETEKPALERFKEELADRVPPSITGLDARLRGDVDRGITEIMKELDLALQSVVNEIDETLMRVARRPDGALPDRSWVVKGDA